MATVKELLDQLENGEITIEEIAAEFAFVEWPETDRKSTLSDVEADPDPVVEPADGFGLVSQAFADGKLDDAGYGALAQAYAEARE